MLTERSGICVTDAGNREIAGAGYAFATYAGYYVNAAPDSYVYEPGSTAKIGVTASVRSEDSDAFATDARAGKLPLWLGVRAPDRADADDFVADATTDPVTLELLRRARAELDLSKRAELYKQVSKLIQQQIARIPLVHTGAPIGASRKVNGLVPRAVGAESLSLIWMGQ